MRTPAAPPTCPVPLRDASLAGLLGLVGLLLALAPVLAAGKLLAVSLFGLGVRDVRILDFPLGAEQLLGRFAFVWCGVLFGLALLGHLAAWVFERVQAGWAERTWSRFQVSRLLRDHSSALVGQLEAGERILAGTELDPLSTPRRRTSVALVLGTMLGAALFTTLGVGLVWLLPGLAWSFATWGIAGLALVALLAGRMVSAIPLAGWMPPAIFLLAVQWLRMDRDLAPELPGWGHPAWILAIVLVGLALASSLRTCRPGRILLVTSKGLRIAEAKDSVVPGVGALMAVARLRPILADAAIHWALEDGAGSRLRVVRPLDPEPRRALPGLGAAGGPVEVLAAEGAPGLLADFWPTRGAAALFLAVLALSTTVTATLVDGLRTVRAELLPALDPASDESYYRFARGVGKVFPGSPYPWAKLGQFAASTGNPAVLAEAVAALKSVRAREGRLSIPATRLLEVLEADLVKLGAGPGVPARGWEPHRREALESFREWLGERLEAASGPSRGRYTVDYRLSRTVGLEPAAPGPRLVGALILMADSTGPGGATTRVAELLAPLAGDPAWAEVAARVGAARPIRVVDHLVADLALAHLRGKPFDPVLARADSLAGSPIVTASLFASPLAREPVGPGATARLLAEPPVDSAGMSALWPALAEARPFVVPEAWRRLPAMTDPELRAFFHAQQERLRQPLDDADLTDLAISMGLLDPGPDDRP